MTPDFSSIVSGNPFDPADKERVLAELRKLARPSEERRYLYGRWARQAGVAITSADMESLSTNADS